MAGTALVTGCSSGIGRAVALRFHAGGWNVIATVRSLQDERVLGAMERMKVVTMDVRDAESVRAGVTDGLQAFGRLDVVVNNAGYSLFGLFEEMPEAAWRDQIESNFFGAVHVLRTVLPQLRKQRDGCIVNVSSLVALAGFPLNSYYSASKWALEGLSEALAIELAAYGVRVKLVQPGLTRTATHGKWSTQEHLHISDYDGYREALTTRVAPNLDDAAVQSADEVAEEIVSAALDTSKRLRYPVGAVTRAIAAMRHDLDEGAFLRAMRAQTLGEPAIAAPHPPREG